LNVIGVHMIHNHTRHTFVIFFVGCRSIQ